MSPQTILSSLPRSSKDPPPIQCGQGEVHGVCHQSQIYDRNNHNNYNVIFILIMITITMYNRKPGTRRRQHCLQQRANRSSCLTQSGLSYLEVAIAINIVNIFIMAIKKWVSLLHRNRKLLIIFLSG